MVADVWALEDDVLDERVYYLCGDFVLGHREA